MVRNGPLSIIEPVEQAASLCFYPHLLILLPSPCTRGEGLGVRGLHCVLICILIVNSMTILISEA